MTSGISPFLRNISDYFSSISIKRYICRGFPKINIFFHPINFHPLLISSSPHPLTPSSGLRFVITLSPFSVTHPPISFTPLLPSDLAPRLLISTSPHLLLSTSPHPVLPSTLTSPLFQSHPVYRVHSPIVFSPVSISTPQFQFPFPPHVVFFSLLKRSPAILPPTGKSLSQLCHQMGTLP